MGFSESSWYKLEMTLKGNKSALQAAVFTAAMAAAGKPISSNSGSDKDPVRMTACGKIPADCS